MALNIIITQRIKGETQYLTEHLDLSPEITEACCFYLLTADEQPPRIGSEISLHTGSRILVVDGNQIHLVSATNSNQYQHIFVLGGNEGVFRDPIHIIHGDNDNLALGYCESLELGTEHRPRLIRRLGILPLVSNNFDQIQFRLLPSTGPSEQFLERPIPIVLSPSLQTRLINFVSANWEAILVFILVILLVIAIALSHKVRY